jgi:hypothetical protein
MFNYFIKAVIFANMSKSTLPAFSPADSASIADGYLPRVCFGGGELCAGGVCFHLGANPPPT